MSWFEVELKVSVSGVFHALGHMLTSVKPSFVT